MDLICSMAECRKPIVGVGVVLADTLGADVDWTEGNFLIYGDSPGSKAAWIALHPNCFVDLFNEFMRQELMTAITMFVGPTGDLLASLVVEED